MCTHKRCPVIALRWRSEAVVDEERRGGMEKEARGSERFLSSRWEFGSGLLRWTVQSLAKSLDRYLSVERFTRRGSPGIGWYQFP
jgi:hypothetical protein